jgi:hypothetical protein
VALSTNSNVQVPSSVLFSNVDGEGVLLNTDTGLYFGLNDVGARIWSMLEQRSPLTAVQERLVDEYEVESEQAWHDLESFIEEMLVEGLVKLDTADSAHGRPD